MPEGLDDGGSDNNNNKNNNNLAGIDDLWLLGFPLGVSFTIIEAKFRIAIRCNKST